MHPIEQLSYILPTLSSIVDRIEPAQLDDATPCDNFTVHDILSHMIVLGGSFSYWFRGAEAPALEAPAKDGTVPAQRFRTTMDDLLGAAASPGALERLITAPVGEMPGDAFARLVAFDGLVHGWDLASSTGSSFEVPPAVVAAVDGFARGALSADMRDGDTFKEATTAPPDATALEQLAAFSGRSVSQWCQAVPR
jgi:uncharacterized protein (TIGR03086 family)